MNSFLAAYLAALVVFAILDGVWLSYMGGAFYRPAMGNILLDQFRLGPAVIFYLLYAAGIVWFAVRPALANADWQMAATQGALLGLMAYGTYNLTNYAILKNWSATLTVVDLAWGTVLTAATAIISHFVTSQLTRLS